MILRNGFISTTFLVCQLLLLLAVVTIRLHAAQPPQQSAVSPAPQVTATSDTGQRDTATEQIIQQQMEQSGDQQLGPERPATNVALGRNEVLIRADELSAQVTAPAAADLDLRPGGRVYFTVKASEVDVYAL